jgi:DNA-binding beta-propeller fold protein YncE
VQQIRYTVSATISVGNGPVGVAFTPDGSKAYVANQFDNTVSVIASSARDKVPSLRLDLPGYTE